MPLPVKFICAFIYLNQETYAKTKAILEKKFGKIDFESESFAFDSTDYYFPEMGQPLFRRFVSFEKLRNPNQFVDIKIFCMKIEKRFSNQERRTINIDPGYLNEAKLILTTTKDFSHRIYLNKGIYAEVTLRFEKGRFTELTSTFPDYRTSKYKDIFHTIRNMYRKQIHSS